MFRKDTTSPDQIDRRIAASFGAVVLLLSLTTAWVASHLYLSLQVQEEDRLAGAITTILSEAINRVAFSGKHHSRLLVEDMLARVPELAYISVETEDGRVLAHSNPALNDSSVFGEGRDNAIKSLKTGQSVLSEHTTANGVIKEIVVPYRGGFDAQTVGTVRVGVQVEATRLAQQTTLYKLLGLVAALTALAIAAVYFLSRSFGGSMRVLGWQLQGILGHAPLGVAICDNRSRLLAHSAELGKMAGQPGENATLESVLSRAFPDASAALSMLQRQVFSGALKVEREVSFETNGIPRSWHISMFPIARDDANHPLLICTLIQDISERKQAEEALRASENQFKTLFSQSPISNLIHDKDSGEIIDANTAAFASYGYSSVEELKAGNFWLEKPYSLDDALNWIRKAADQGPQRFEWLSRRVTGELFWEHVHLSPVVINGVERILASGIDITERKRLELRLADQLAFQQALMDTIPYAVFYKDAETRFMGCNIAYEETFGVQREDFIGKRVLDLEYLPEQDRLAYQAEDEATIAAVGRVHKEMSIPFADGLHHQTLYSVSGFRQADGSPGGLIGVIVDISDLKHAEMALRESEAHYRSVIENIQDMYYRTDRDGRLVLLSPSTPKQLGYETVEEILGRPASDFYFDPADRQALLSRIREEGAVKDYEVLLKTREGHPMMVSTTSAYYRDANGNVMGVEGIFRDIAERKRMESALRASEEKYRTIFDNAPVGIFRTTFAGKFIEANATLARMIGYDSSVELIRNVQDVGDDLYYEPRFKTMLREALLNNPSHVGQEVEFKRRDGSRFYAFINASLQFDENGQPTFLDGTIEDINERKKMQELMVQTEKMMSVGGLAAGMAHELNNPLGIILQSVQSMERRLSPSLPGNQTVARELTLNLDVLGEYMRARGIDDYLQGIREAGERAAKIIRAMLDFSRSSQSVRSSCQVHEMLDTALGLASNDYDLKKKYDFKSIAIERDYDLSADGVECTETEIVQVLLNIIKNAAQAMPGRGDRPEPPTLRLRTRHMDDAVRIEITDNGPGMDENLRRRVFEPFFTTKPQGEGTGLGLSVAYFIITHKHRGKIAAESTAGLGTTFVIELPLE